MARPPCLSGARRPIRNRASLGHPAKRSIHINGIRSTIQEPPFRNLLLMNCVRHSILLCSCRGNWSQSPEAKSRRPMYSSTCVHRKLCGSARFCDSVEGGLSLNPIAWQNMEYIFVMITLCHNLPLRSIIVRPSEVLFAQFWPCSPFRSRSSSAGIC